MTVGVRQTRAARRLRETFSPSCVAPKGSTEMKSSIVWGLSTAALIMGAQAVTGTARADIPVPSGTHFSADYRIYDQCNAARSQAAHDGGFNYVSPCRIHGSGPVYAFNYGNR